MTMRLFLLQAKIETDEGMSTIEAARFVADETYAARARLPESVRLADQGPIEILDEEAFFARLDEVVSKFVPYSSARAEQNEITRTVRNQGRAIQRIEGAIERLASLVGASLVGDEAARDLLREDRNARRDASIERDAARVADAASRATGLPIRIHTGAPNVNPPSPRQAAEEIEAAHVAREIDPARLRQALEAATAEAAASLAQFGMPISIPPGTRLREVVVGGQRVKVVEKLELDTAETVDDDAPAPRVCGGTLGHVFAELDYAEVKPGTRCQCGALVRTQTGISLAVPSAPPIAPDEVDWGKIAREAPVGHRFDPPVPIDFSTAPPAPDRYAKLEDRAGERGLENIRSTSMNVGTNRSEIEKFGPDGKLVKEPLPRFGESLPARSDIK